MFKKLKEKLDETGLKNKILDYASNANAGSGEPSNKASSATTSPASKSKVAGSSPPSNFESSAEQLPWQEGVVEDWSAKEEGPGIGWDPAAAASPVSGSRVAVLPSDTEESEADDINPSLEAVSKERLLAELKRWHARYQRSKAKCSQRAKAYQELNYEKEKLQSALSETQDRLLRRQAELREQCVLEQQAKAHLEQNLRVLLDEKDEHISVLESKIQLLKDGTGTSEPPPFTGQAENVEELQKKVKRLEELLNRCRQTLTSNKEQSAQLKKQLEEKDSDVKQALEQELKLREQILCMEQENKKECSECLGLKKVENDMQEKVSILEHQVEQLKTELTSKIEDHALSLEMSQKNACVLEQKLVSSCEDYEAQLSQVKSELLSKDQETLSHQERYFALDKQVESLENQVAGYKSQSERLCDVEQCNVDINKAMEELKLKCQELEQQIEGKDKSLSHLHQTLQEKNKESGDVVDLRKRYSILDKVFKEKMKEYETSKKCWQEEETKLHKSIQQWEEKYNAFESRFQEYEQKNDVAENKSVALEIALMKSKEEADEYAQKFKKEYAENMKCMEEYKSQLELESKKKAVFDMELINTLNAKTDELKSEKKTMELKIQEAELLIEQLKSTSDSISERLKESEEKHGKELHRLGEKCTRLENDLCRKENEVLELSQTNNANCAHMNEILQSKESDLIKANEKLNDTINELNLTSKEKDHHLQTCKSLEARCESLVSQLGGMQDNSSQVIQELHMKCSDLQLALDTINKTHTDFQNDFATLQIKLGEKEKDCLVLSTQNEEFVQNSKDMEVKCESLNMSLQDKTKESEENFKTFEISFAELKNRMLEQSEEYNLNLARLSSQLEEFEVLKAREVENLKKIQNTEEKCYVYEQQLTVMEESEKERISVLEEQLKALQKNSEEKEAENAEIKKQLQHQHSEVLKQFEKTVQGLEDKVVYLDNKLKLEGEHFQTERTDLELKSSVLNEQLNQKDEVLTNTVKDMEERYQHIERLMNKTNEEHITAVDSFKKQCQQLHDLLIDKSAQYDQAEQSWNAKYEHAEAIINENQSLITLYAKSAEEMQMQIKKQILQIESLEQRCETYSKEINQTEDENLSKLRALEDQNKQLDLIVTRSESDILQLQQNLEEKNSQIVIFRDAEIKYFEKTQLLEELCQSLEHRLVDNENNYGTIIGDLREKCSKLEPTQEDRKRASELQEKCQLIEVQLKDHEANSQKIIKNLQEKCYELQSAVQARAEADKQSQENFQKTVQLQEKCQRLEIQLKDIEEDSQQTISRLQEKCSDLESALKARASEEEIETAEAVQNLGNKCRDLEAAFKEEREDSSSALENWKAMCQELEEKLNKEESESTILIESMTEKCDELEKEIKEEKVRTSQFFQRLVRAQHFLQKNEHSMDFTIKTVPSDWQEKAEAILQCFEKTLQLKAEPEIHPQLSTLTESDLPNCSNPQQVKLFLQKMSKQMQERDYQHEKELQEALKKADDIERKYIREEESEVQQLAQQVAEQSAANEDMREHFLLQIQEKNEEILSLQKQLQTPSKKSDWDNAWDMEEDEMCNNPPVQSVVVNELQAVMNDNNKADLDQLERFLSLPSVNSATQKASLESTEFEYLRNVLLAYMTGREPMIMAKVIAAVLRFPEEDTKEILRREAARNNVTREVSVTSP